MNGEKFSFVIILLEQIHGKKFRLCAGYTENGSF